MRVEEGTRILNIPESSLEKVRLSHYNGSEYDSPVQSLEAFSTVSSSDLSTASVSSDLVTYQCLENTKQFAQTRPYKCHIKPRKKCKNSKLESSEDNIITATHHFHQYFDGMNTEDHKTGVFDIPMIAIKPELPPESRDFRKVDLPAANRTRVDVIIECRDRLIADNIVTRLKDGTDYSHMSELLLKTFVHVSNPTTFCDCLQWKYDDTKQIWKDTDNHFDLN